MANYYGVGRSNTFLVKDVAALKKTLEPGEFEVVEYPHRDPNAVMLVVNDCDGNGGWCQWIYPADGDEPEELSVPDVIAEHLQDGQVAVFQHSGAEAKRYVIGHSIAVHSSGQQVTVDINDIYSLAAVRFGIDSDQINWAAY
ncbi:hypothetical protein [Mycolicibacterium fortuitum]